MPPPEQNPAAMSVEIEHLKSGQKRIEIGMGDVSGKIDGVGRIVNEFSASLIKRDALVERLFERVVILEDIAQARTKIANRGEAYMNTTKYLLPVALTMMCTCVGWLITRVDGHDLKIHQIEITQAENNK